MLKPFYALASFRTFVQISEDYQWRHAMDQSRVGDSKRYGTEGEEEFNWMYDIFTLRNSYKEYSGRKLNPR